VEAEAILERIDRCIRELEAGIHPAAGTTRWFSIRGGCARDYTRDS